LADAKTVHLVAGHKIEFGQHKKPPALDRGVCTDCQRPVMGFMGLIPGVKLAFIPRYALGETDGLPPVSKHIWYQSRIADVDDDVVKVEGKLHSNMACLGPFYKGYRGK
jgi:hypothetical protein